MRGRQIFFEKGVFLCAVRHRIRIRRHRREARVGTIGNAWLPAPAMSISTTTTPTEVIQGSFV